MGYRAVKGAAMVQRAGVSASRMIIVTAVLAGCGPEVSGHYLLRAQVLDADQSPYEGAQVEWHIEYDMHYDTVDDVPDYCIESLSVVTGSDGWSEARLTTYRDDSWIDYDTSCDVERITCLAQRPGEYNSSVWTTCEGHWETHRCDVVLTLDPS